MAPSPFPFLENLPPFATQPTSYQYPVFTPTSNIPHSSPYVRIVVDENPIPPNQPQPFNSSTSIPIPTQPSHYHPAQQQQFPMFDQGNSSGEFVEGKPLNLVKLESLKMMRNTRE
ncbi:hypothetical protein Hdeb2414_s0001g00028641 [Helianthus debilis subsp. tardiflorus]